MFEWFQLQTIVWYQGIYLFNPLLKWIERSYILKLFPFPFFLASLRSNYPSVLCTVQCAFCMILSIIRKTRCDVIISPGWDNIRATAYLIVWSFPHPLKKCPVKKLYSFFKGLCAELIPALCLKSVDFVLPGSCTVQNSVYHGRCVTLNKTI